MGKSGAHTSDEALVISIHCHGQTIGQVILKLHRVRHRFTALPHIGKGSCEQIGVPMLAEAKDHRGTHVKGVTLALKAATRTTRNPILLKHNGFGAFGSQLRCGHQPSNAGTDHNHIPVWV